MFKMVINWPVAVILSNFDGNQEEKKLFSIIIYCFLSIVFIYADSSRASVSHLQSTAIVSSQC